MVNQATVLSYHIHPLRWDELKESVSQNYDVGVAVPYDPCKRRNGRNDVNDVGTVGVDGNLSEHNETNGWGRFESNPLNSKTSGSPEITDDTEAVYDWSADNGNIGNESKPGDASSWLTRCEYGRFCDARVPEVRNQPSTPSALLLFVSGVPITESFSDVRVSEW